MKTQINIKKYIEQRDLLRNRFEAEKTGDQILFTDQSKLFKPVIESQVETSKAIQEKFNMNPLVQEFQRRNDYLEALQPLAAEHSSVPFHSQIEASSTPKKLHDTLLVDVDKDLLNDTHRENLQDMSLELPSVVQKSGTFEEALRQVESQKRSIGQYLGKKSKLLEHEREMYESRKETLKIYKGVIKGLQTAQQFVVKGKGCRPKRGKGRPKKFKDTIIYSCPDDLVVKLNELCSSKLAGNTGLDNIINSVLDELLRIKAVTIDEYDKLHKAIFT